jgi:hypothetical protein
MPQWTDDPPAPTRAPSTLDTASFMRLLLINGGAGAVLGLCFVAGVLVLDIAHIRSMLVSSGDWEVPIALLTMGSVVTFASVAMGGAIMLLPKATEEPRPPSRGLGADLFDESTATLAPVKLPSRRNPRHPAN